MVMPVMFGGNPPIGEAAMEKWQPFGRVDFPGR
jgi:hypothetical protein